MRLWNRHELVTAAARIRSPSVHGAASRKPRPARLHKRPSRRNISPGGPYADSAHGGGRVQMRLGLSLGYQTAWTTPADHLALAQEAERLGFSVVWAAEAYGSDAPTMLSWIAGQTSTIDVGSGIMQIPARTPAMTAMTAATIDTLSGGRFRLGVGVSGPQVSEGWHGVRFAKPRVRTREYVEILRAARRRETVSYDGEFYL